MVRLSLLLFFSFKGVLVLASECVQDDTQVRSMVERINRRYDDFFEVMREREQRQRRIEASRENLRAKREAREREIELARIEYVKNRRPRPDDSHLQAQYQAELRERERKIEVARKCYVQRKDYAAEILKRGRTIPARLEFGLDEY